MKVYVLIAALLGISGAMAKPIIAFVGDSLTDGYGLSRDQAFPAQLQKLLVQSGYPQVEIVNAGESGASSGGTARRIRWILRPKSPRQPKPDVLVLCLGANDSLRGLNATNTEKQLSEGLSAAHDLGVKTVFAGIKMPLNMGGRYEKSLEEMYARLAKKFPKALFIPFLLEGVAGDPKLNLPDGIHPNAQGHQQIAKHILPTVLSALKDLNKSPS